MNIMKWLLNQLIVPFGVGVLVLAYGDRLKTTPGTALAWTKAQRIELNRARLATVEALHSSADFAILFFTEALTDTVLQASHTLFLLTFINAAEEVPFTKSAWTLEGFIHALARTWKGTPLITSLLVMLIGIYYVHQRSNDALHINATRTKIKKRLEKLGYLKDA